MEFLIHRTTIIYMYINNNIQARADPACMGEPGAPTPI